MQADADLLPLMALCHALPLASLEPRRPLHLGIWQEEWEDNLAILDNFAQEVASSQACAHRAPDRLPEACVQWENAAQTASTLLRMAIDRGAPATMLRALYRAVVPLWLDYAQVLRHAQSAGCAPVPQAIRPATTDYQFALQLLALGVLLDEADDIPAIVEQLLHWHTDRVLDYLSAAELDLQEASETCLHPQPFAGLDAFFEQYGEVSPAPLLPYLEQHYSHFFALSAQEQKQHPRLQGPQAWGWWALEVGALVVLYGLDDTALRDVSHYPADLVDYALGIRD